MPSIKQSLRTVTGLGALSLLLWLTGCANPQLSVKTERDLPPESLLRDCPDPGYTQDATNAGLVLYTQALRAALASCNDDKTSLQQWAKD